MSAAERTEHTIRMRDKPAVMMVASSLGDDAHCAKLVPAREANKSEPSVRIGGQSRAYINRLSIRYISI